ncbi:MAG: hypothetical protein ACOZAR_01380 [Patescibacteria group bacterium]
MQKIINPENFVDNSIFDLLEIREMSDEKKNEIMKDMMTTINNRVLARTLDLVDERNLRKSFESLLDKNDQAKIESFLSENNIDLKIIAVEEAMLYKMELVNTLGK